MKWTPPPPVEEEEAAVGPAGGFETGGHRNSGDSTEPTTAPRFEVLVELRDPFLGPESGRRQSSLGRSHSNGNGDYRKVADAGDESSRAG